VGGSGVAGSGGNLVASVVVSGAVLGSVPVLACSPVSLAGLVAA
jgi:hypothetical protein